MKFAIPLFFGLVHAATAFDGGYCHSSAQAAAKAIDAVNFPGRNIQSVRSSFAGYEGRHTKKYIVEITYDRVYETPYETPTRTSRYQERVFEFENEDGVPCTIGQIGRSPAP